MIVPMKLTATVKVTRYAVPTKRSLMALRTSLRVAARQHGIPIAKAVTKTMVAKEARELMVTMTKVRLTSRTAIAARS